MSPEGQDQIKALVDEYGADKVVVILGAVDLDSVKMAAETVTTGDPAYVGALAGVQLNLSVVHILEADVKSQVEASVYREQVGLVELASDVQEISRSMMTWRDS